MSEQISQELLRIMNDMADNETTIAKIEASVFVRECEKMVQEKVAYLYNILQVEAKSFNQKQEDYFDDVNVIISHYKEKLNMVYDELYCQYVNVQNEFQEASINRKITMIKYQKLVNEEESKEALEDIQSLKEKIKEKNSIYQKIMDMCRLKLTDLRKDFETAIQKDFLISSKSLQVISEQNIVQRLLGKLLNLFNGTQKYTEALKNYHKSVDSINAYYIVEQMRTDIVEFVADILEIRGVNENELEDARLGGRNV